MGMFKTYRPSGGRYSAPVSDNKENNNNGLM